jgi:hypothetical protein
VAAGRRPRRPVGGPACVPGRSGGGWDRHGDQRAAAGRPASATAVERVRFAAPGLADTGAIAHPQTASRELVSVAGWRICPHVTVTVG